MSEIQNDIKIDVPYLIEFVERIESRVPDIVLKYPHLSKYGWLLVSREELFVELQNIANQFVHNSKVNKIYCKNQHCPSCTHCKNNQFMYMWKEIKKKYNYYQEHGYKEVGPAQDVVACSRCHNNIPFSISNFSSDECFICLFEGATPSNNQGDESKVCKICNVNPKYQTGSICKQCHNIKALINKDPTKIGIGNHHFIPKKCLDCGGVTRRNSIGKYMIRCEPCGKMHLEKSKTYRKKG